MARSDKVTNMSIMFTDKLSKMVGTTKRKFVATEKYCTFCSKYYMNKRNMAWNDNNLYKWLTISGRVFNIMCNRTI